MADLKAMNVDKLEVYRIKLAGEIEGKQAEFRAAGKEKAKKIAASPKAKAMKQIADAREVLVAIAEEGE